MLRAQGHTTVWRTYRGVYRATDTNRWDLPLKQWWAARQQAPLAALKADWDAPRETFTPRRADAAPEMAIAQAGSLAPRVRNFTLTHVIPPQLPPMVAQGGRSH